MSTPEDSVDYNAEWDSRSPFADVRYSLPELLREVNRDRASRAFAMEKLDQPSITTLFEQQQRARRDADPQK